MRQSSLLRFRAFACGVLLQVMLAQGAGAQQIALRHFDQSDGLASLSVSAMLIDQAGYVWAGTESGLFRYNGRAFERQGVASPIETATIRTLAQQEGGDGTIFVGTASGLYAEHGNSIGPVQAGTESLPMLLGPVLAAQSDGRMLAVSGGALWELRAGPDQRWRATAVSATPADRGQLPGPILAVYIERNETGPDGTIWLVCGPRLCVRAGAGVKGGGLTVWADAAGVPADHWQSFLTDHAGRLWVRGREHLIMLQPGARHFTEMEPPHATLTSSYRFSPLAEDAAGRVLTRTNEGIARLENGNWHEFTAANGLSRLAVRTLLRDRQGAIWMSNSGRGVARWLAYDNVESWTTAQGLPGEPVWQMVRLGERVLINTAGGCSIVAAGATQAGACGFDGLPPGQPMEIAATKAGDVWFEFPHGLLHAASGSSTATAVPGLAGADILYADPAGQLWLSYPDHLLVIAGDGSDVTTARRIPLPHAADRPTGASAVTVNAMVMDRSGALWVAGFQGLYRLAGGVWTRQPLPAAAVDGLQDLTLDSDGRGEVLWAAGYPHGLLRAELTSNGIGRANWVDSSLVNSSSVMFARVDQRHRVWVGTEQGVAVFDGSRWRRLSQADGLIWNDVDEDSFLADADGSVWVGTGNGVSHIRHPEALLADRPLDAQFSMVTIGAARYPSLAEGTGAEAPLTLPWSADMGLTVDLALLDFDRSATTSLRTRLTGRDQDWAETRDDRLRYSNLPAGRYTLQIEAVDREHDARSPMLMLSFRLLAPWWQRSWFRVIELVLAIAFAALALRWWTRRVNRRRQHAEQQLEEHRGLLHLATHDALTGLLNRGAIMDILCRELEQAQLSMQGLAVALIDFDHFKRINDTSGHVAGDAVLRELAATLRGQIRATDSLGRYGGEEFLLVMPGLPEANPEPFLERMRISISDAATLHQGARLGVTASIGVAWNQGAAETAEILVERADAALYRAKHAGRDRVSYGAS